ncbi:MAG: hypothetical protein KUG77_04180, partial [Nannocystaceae bacterium]|nr:hypothetical protein [Nannocystaceae bacterium]
LPTVWTHTAAILCLGGCPSDDAASSPNGTSTGGMSQVATALPGTTAGQADGSGTTGFTDSGTDGLATMTDGSGSGSDSGAAAACDDELHNGTETDIDCGGDCDACVDGAGCTMNDDCVSLACDEDAGLCVGPTCDDGNLGEGETDIDCGGDNCDACDDGAGCIENNDCASGACNEGAGVCVAATCDDGKLAVGETDIDCGGPTCDGCVPGQTCVDGGDCLSGVCDDAINTCTAATCGDEVQNHPSEDCDTGGDSATCDADCTVVSCGDGHINALNPNVAEVCDDNNPTDNDGCTGCTVDPGYDCVGEPSACAPQCGDSVIAGDETCDDGDAIGGNGCAADCTTELYYRCVGEGPGSCAPVRTLWLLAASDDAVARASMAAITGGVVDYMNAGVLSPTAMELSADYDCVFTHPNNSYSDSDAVGTALAAFADDGANVVLGIAAGFEPPTGLAGTAIMEVGYSPVTTSGAVEFTANDYAGDGTTVIHSNVVAYGNSLHDTGVMLQGAGTQDGTLADGATAAAFRPDFRVVYLNGTPHAAFGNTGDWDRMVANACSAGFVQ